MLQTTKTLLTIKTENRVWCELAMGTSQLQMSLDHILLGASQLSCTCLSFGRIVFCWCSFPALRFKPCVESLFVVLQRTFSKPSQPDKSYPSYIKYHDIKYLSFPLLMITYDKLSILLQIHTRYLCAVTRHKAESFEGFKFKKISSVILMT